MVETDPSHAEFSDDVAKKVAGELLAASNALLASLKGPRPLITTATSVAYQDHERMVNFTGLNTDRFAVTRVVAGQKHVVTEVERDEDGNKVKVDREVAEAIYEQLTICGGAKPAIMFSSGKWYLGRKGKIEFGTTSGGIQRNNEAAVAGSRHLIAHGLK